jgi:hypothetical protein
MPFSMLSSSGMGSANLTANRTSRNSLIVVLVRPPVALCGGVSSASEIAAIKDAGRAREQNENANSD